MKLMPMSLAVAIATAQLSGVAFAQATNTPAAPAAPAESAATKPPVAIESPADWIRYDDTTYTPVADEVSRHLAAARKAIDAGDSGKAAREMHAVADDLKEQANRAARTGQDRAQADTKLAQDAETRLNFAAGKVSAAAVALESGKIKTRAGLDTAIDRAARADMERRWVVTDVATWYPVSEEPQRHFRSAIEAQAKKDYKTAGTEIRKAAGYLRLEAGRASGEAKRALDSSVADLDKLAVSVDKGVVKTEKSMDRTFAKASHALVLEHRAKATEAWAHGQYEKAGYEFKAAAHALESAAGWAGGEAKPGVAAASADTRSLGDKLVSGATWTRDEVDHAFKSLGNAVGALDRPTGSNGKASAHGA
jgi:hypothetical protein